MTFSAKEMIRQRKSVRTFDGSFAFDDPGIQTPPETYYIVTYERNR